MDASVSQVVFTFISLALSILFSKDLFNSVGLFFGDLAEGLRGFVLPIKELHNKYKNEVIEEFINSRSYDKNDFIIALEERIQKEVSNTQNTVRSKTSKIITCNMTILQLLFLITVIGFFSKFMSDAFSSAASDFDVIWILLLSLIWLYVPYFIWVGKKEKQFDRETYALYYARYPLTIFLLLVLGGFFFTIEWLMNDSSELLRAVSFLGGTLGIVFFSTSLYRIPLLVNVIRNDELNDGKIDLTNPGVFKSQLFWEYTVYSLSAWAVWGIHTFAQPVVERSESWQWLANEHYYSIILAILFVPVVRMFSAYLYVIGNRAFQIYFDSSEANKA